MNAIVPIGSSGIVPQGMDDAIRLAKAMSTIPELPKHLHDSVGTCLMVVDQAMRWRMSPFAVAQHSFNIGGKMGYEGKIMAAAVESTGAIVGGFDYKWAGAGDDRTITVSATRAGESEPRTMTIRLGDVKTTNEMWKKQPDQQLVYSGCRNWARRWTPAALLGAYAPEEFERPQPEPFTGATVEGKAERLVEDTPPAETARDAINREVPLTKPAERTPDEPIDDAAPKLPPWKDFCKSLALAFRACKSIEEATAIVGRRETQFALKTYKDVAEAELKGVIAVGVGKFGPVTPPDDMLDEVPAGEPDGWPGPDPADMRRERETADARA
jgi:hypothetical protein